jgi:hypothetical protein
MGLPKEKSLEEQYPVGTKIKIKAPDNSNKAQKEGEKNDCKAILTTELK